MTALRTRSRVLTVALVLGLGLTMAACGSSDDSSDGSSDGPQTTVQRGSDPESEYCQTVLDNIAEDADAATVTEEQSAVAPEELADAYEVLSENVDLLDAYDTLDAEQRAPIEDELQEIVAYQVHTCGVDISGG